MFLSLTHKKKTMELASLKPEGRFVFVGDTHGDLDVSIKIIENYLKIDTRICFLGDYVDRGFKSKENIEYLLEKREKNPEKIFLLQGNHERYDVVRFSPADFWNSLGENERKKYSGIFAKFPYVLSVDKIIALHGALPDVKKIEDINNVIDGDENWKAILWGDFQERGFFEAENFSGRPQFGEQYFKRIMKQLNKNVLIKSHNPYTKECLFGNKCLTIFTSSAYKRQKTIAIVDFNKNRSIKTINDLVVEKI
jgi:predicted MPP superfamily phosphohydrolase